ncbi:hypothetical protein Cflav_PD0827 [Pedosphaera parvula Ellin514]|uniref:Sel1 domain protein repeat-containing protein n=2 Tax=Pedosphaera TaxID=1032526 RepID=B9XQR3_PEDPL|nr:hypothetical protein Cflav_PD0827 [Pedosphaera parvula Ellin514]
MDITSKMLTEADSVEQLELLMQSLERELANGNGRAGFLLANAYGLDNSFFKHELGAPLKPDFEKALHFFKLSFPALCKEAELGNGEAMHLVGIYYQGGTPPVARDSAQHMVWSHRAFEAGYIPAANDLYSYYSNKNSEVYDQEKAAYYLKILTDTGTRFVV